MYKVTMRFRVMERKTDVELIPSFVNTFTVHPPVYTAGDEAIIEMHVELQTKLKCMYQLRKRLQLNDPVVLPLAGQDFIVRGELVEYLQHEH